MLRGSRLQLSFSLKHAGGAVQRLGQDGQLLGGERGIVGVDGLVDAGMTTAE